MMTEKPIPEAIAALDGSFQSRVLPWLVACFGEKIAGDKIERNHRFLEEALELAQACDCARSEAYQLVDYVFGRDVGEKSQEVGGVMNTLAALCLAHGLDMHDAAEIELARVWTKCEQIRAKQAAKPKYGPLPQHAVHPPSALSDDARKIVEALRPFYAAVFNDNGDMTISTGHLTTHEWWALDRVFPLAESLSQKIEALERERDEISINFGSLIADTAEALDCAHDDEDLAAAHCIKYHQARELD